MPPVGSNRRGALAFSGLTATVDTCNDCTMTTTENVNPEHATDLLIATSVNHPDGQIGTPTSSRRNYSLAEAMACAAICERFTLHDFNGLVILTGHNATVGDYRWYVDTTPRPVNPWKA